MVKLNWQFVVLNKKMVEKGFLISKVYDDGMEWYKPIGLATVKVWLYHVEDGYIGYDDLNGGFSASSFGEAATRLFQRLECITG
jgi:hypothetical protein